MSTEVLNQTLQAGVKAIFGAGTAFLVQSLTNTVTITARSIGNSNKNRIFSNVPAGFKFTADSADDGFDTLEILSAGGDTITIAVGNDDVTFASTVNIANIPKVQDNPAAAVTDAPNVALPNGAQTAVFAANLSRRRIKVSFASNAAIPPATVFFRKAGGANNLLEVQPGEVYPFDGSYGIDVENNSGGDLTAMIFEET